MEEKIRSLLLDSVKPQELLTQIAVGFYERMEEVKNIHRTLALMLHEYESFTEYFRAENDVLTEQEQDWLQDMQEDMIYQTEVYFDDREDRIMEALLVGKLAEEIKADLQKKGIVLLQDLSADEVESVYAKAFEQFDQLHFKFVERLFELSPRKAYEKGASETAEYRKKHHIVFDEKDFIEAYSKTFSKEGLWRLLRERLEQTMKYGRRYTLLWEELDELEEEQEEKDLEDGVLEPGDAFSNDMFGYVYELMQEYTGRRILPSENEWGEQAYWTTYQDDFQEIMGFFILDHFENTIRKLEEERTAEYSSFGRMLGLEKQQRMDPELVLARCDRVNYFLTGLNEELWNEFTETRIEDILK